jgi:Ca2+-binding RTX toxin-like protein
MVYVGGTIANDRLTGTDSGDLLRGFEGNDWLYGGYGADTFDGGAGDDYFEVRGSEGPDSFIGGSGNDTIVIDRPNPAYYAIELEITWIDSVEVIMNLTDLNVNIKTKFALDLSKIILQNITSLDGSDDNNYLTGNMVFDTASQQFRGIGINGYGGNDELTGSTKNDSLNGGTGNDILIGGKGNDTLIGGAGSDTFRFDTGSNIDIIQDFTIGADKIEIGPSILNVNVLDYSGSALLEFGGGSYALLSGVPPTAITANDILFA